MYTESENVPICLFEIGILEQLLELIGSYLEYVVNKLRATLFSESLFKFDNTADEIRSIFRALARPENVRTRRDCCARKKSHCIY